MSSQKYLSMYLSELEKQLKSKDKLIDPRSVTHNECVLTTKDYVEIENFWKRPIDYEDPRVIKDSSPFLVMTEAPLSKVHFLFTMLSIPLLFVVKKGKIKGIITKLDFIKKRKTLLSSDDEEKEQKHSVALVTVKDYKQRVLISDAPLCKVQRYQHK